ncbi:hypothetical protein, partial [Amycolatopsis rhizosphaerae]|uniref:hypothetical protein n=1 Tax=Amycolatopsis rhizosphaerae TaxID=2053003 RepID=UPI001C93A247
GKVRGVALPREHGGHPAPRHVRQVRAGRGRLRLRRRAQVGPGREIPPVGLMDRPARTLSTLVRA